jgi:hypothetical protein
MNNFELIEKQKDSVTQKSMLFTLNQWLDQVDKTYITESADNLFDFDHSTADPTISFHNRAKSSLTMAYDSTSNTLSALQHDPAHSVRLSPPSMKTLETQSQLTMKRLRAEASKKTNLFKIKEFNANEAVQLLSKGITMEEHEKIMKKGWNYANSMSLPREDYKK